MSRSSGSALFSLLLAARLAAAAPPVAPAAEVPFDDGPPPGWPQKIVVPEPPATPPEAGELPEPTFTAPFEIGEALYDPARAADAAVSLLDLLGVAIGDGEDRWVRPGRPKGGAPFHFTEHEARAFVARAVASATAAAETGEPSLTFADLHRAVAPQLPGWSADRLAAAYAQAYEQHPDDLAPAVMLGQPITPETPLLYPQLWLLIVDGFVPPEGTPRPGRATPASAPTSAGPSWGTAAQRAPPLNASWASGVAPHIGHWLYLNGPAVSPASARAHEGHGGPGAPVHLSAAFNTRPQPIPGALNTIAVDIRRPPALAGLEVYWRSPDADKLLAHGSFSVPLEQPMRTDASGAVQIVYQPKSEPARGRGRLVRDSAQIQVKAKAGEMADAFFFMTPNLGSWLFPEVNVGGEYGRIRLEWHELETIELTIQNKYNVRLPLGGVATAWRRGKDTLYGTLAKTPDDTWYGLMHASVEATQEVRGFGIGCGRGSVYAVQDIHVVGTPITAFGPTHPAGSYHWTLNQPGSEKLSLEFYPAFEPTFYSGRGRCWPAIPSPRSVFPFIPFNDAQWTIEHAGYGIALPDEGQLSYVEVALNNVPGGGTPNPAPSSPPGGLGQALRLLSEAQVGSSKWYVTIDRQNDEP